MTHNEKIMAIEGIAKAIDSLAENSNLIVGDDPKEINENLDNYYLIGLLTFSLKTMSSELVHEVLSSSNVEP